MCTGARLDPPAKRYVHTDVVTVPILVNVRAISAGEEILLHVAGAPELRGQPKVSKRKKSWLDDAMKHEVAQRRTARPS